MQATRRRDTSAEMAIRRELHRRGLRYRVDRAPLAGSRRRADIVFGAARVAVYVDGCFWHRCPEHGTLPKANRAWWEEKLLANQRRDQDTNERLTAAGWLPVRVWEHEEPAAAADRIERLVRARRPDRPR